LNIAKNLLLSLLVLSAPAWAQTCQPSAATAYLNINGTSSWVAASSATLSAGSKVVLVPLPGKGDWSWEGCGTSGDSRTQTLKLSTSCTATATLTNACGAKTVLPYTFTVWPAPAADAGKYIMVDQFGYLPKLNKVAVLRSPVIGYDAGQSYTPSNTLQVVNLANGAVVFSGPAAPWQNGKTDTSSGDRAWTFDFSSVTTPGTYEIVDVERKLRSARFEIGDNVYRNVLIQAVRTFFYQRAGQIKKAAHAGANWADGASHLGPGQDSQARRFLDKKNPATERDLRGGWFDAGDMNKYTSWTAGYTQELMDAYVQNPSVWTDDFNLPESNNGIPDLLDEAKWGMDSLVRLQNDDGSVLSVVTMAGGSPPSSATGPSYYGDASTSATLAAAAAYAEGAKVFGSLDNPAMKAYAADLLSRAKRAYDWAVANPQVVFRNNDASNKTAGLAVGQQETDDKGRAVMRMQTAIKLFAATGDASYRDYVDAHYKEAEMFKNWSLSGFSAGDARVVLYYAALPGATASVAADIRTRYLDLMGRPDYDNWGAVESQKDPYRAHIGAYTWSSNSVKANAGTLFAEEAYYGIGRHTAEQANNAAADYLHYLHGVNPLGKVYLTNMTSFGAQNSTNHIWHTWFFNGTPWGDAKNSAYGPAPGFVVGGPAGSQWDWDGGCPGASPKCGATRPTPPYGQPPQKSYADFNDGWPLNSWSISENSNGYQVAYIRLLARFVK
jgi:hypothetical protein